MSSKPEQSRITGPQAATDMAAAFDGGVGKANDPGRSPTEPYDVPQAEASAALIAKNKGTDNV